MNTMTAIGPAAISEQDINRYEEDGAICLRGMVDERWLGRLRKGTERILASGGMDMAKKGQTGKFVGDLNVWQKDPDFKAFALEGPSWWIAKALMRSSEARLFADQLFVKEPGTSSPSPWHQDQPYWPVLGDHVCSVWVAMDDVTTETSGLEYIRGSHRWGRRFDPADFGERSLKFMHEAGNEEIPDIDSQRDKYEFLSWDMKAGDVLVHNSLAVHGAGGNRSATQRRRAISTRWFGDEAYFKPRAPFFTSETVGLEPGARMTSPMFPVVPVQGGLDATPSWGPGRP